MKKFSIISAAAATLAIALTGCNKFENGGRMTKAMLSVVEEKTGPNITRTEYEWGETGLVGEKQFLNSSLVYEDSDFERDETKGTFTRYRAFYDGGSVAYRQRLVETYAYNFALMYKYQVFLLGPDGSDTDPIEYWEDTFRNDGSYGVLLSGREEGDQNTVTVRSNYLYDGNTLTYTEVSTPRSGGAASAPKTVTTTYLDATHRKVSTVETKVNGKIIEFTKYKYSGNLMEYETYAGNDISVSSGAITGGDGKLIEKCDNYKVSTYEESYDITKYDPDGTNGVVTSFKITYKDVTFNY